MAYSFGSVSYGNIKIPSRPLFASSLNGRDLISNSFR